MMKTGALVLLFAGLASCASQGSEAAERAPDTTGRRDSIAGVAAAALNENSVIWLLDHVHAADSALGALGAAQGSTLDVKDFGRMVFREHHALRRDLQALAGKQGLAPQPSTVAPDDAPAAVRDSLATDPGARWDRAYTSYAIALHHASMENTARALAATSNPEVKAFIEKSIPILQKHLDKARSLRRALPRPRDTTTTRSR